MIKENQPALHIELEQLNLVLVEKVYVATMEVKPTLEQKIQTSQ